MQFGIWIVFAVVWGVVEVWRSRSGELLPEPAPVTAQPQPAPEATAGISPAAEGAPATTTEPVAAPPTEERRVPASPAPRDPGDTAAANAPPDRPTETPGDVATGAGVVRLRLEFSDASWTEIYDATGNRLMFDTGAPGRVRSVSGVAPLRVTLGYASGVTMQVNDRPLAVPRRPGKDAGKFTVAADGSVSP